MIEPDIELYAVGAGGVQEPRKAWTEAARAALSAGRARIAAGRAASCTAPGLRPPAELPPDSRLGQLQLLNEAVSMSILTYAGRRTALRNKRGKLDWTLGPGVAELREATGADYALFTYVRDSYTSGGRAAMRVDRLPAARRRHRRRRQIGVTTLVDLRTGQVVWFNLCSTRPATCATRPARARPPDDLLEGHPHEGTAAMTAVP